MEIHVILWYRPNYHGIIMLLLPTALAPRSSNNPFQASSAPPDNGRGVTAMQLGKTVVVIVLIIGIGLLAASLLADVVGIGAEVGFGRRQTWGAFTGVVITAVGLALRKGLGSTNRRG